MNRFITVKTSKTGDMVSIPLFPMLQEILTKMGPRKTGHIFPEQAEMYKGNPDGITYRVAQAALVDEDDGAAFAQGFFLSLGHSWVFRAAMASSLRSRARPTGRCGLKPIRPNNRQTWTVLKLGPPSLIINARTRGSVHTSAAKPCRLAPAIKAWRSRSIKRSSIVLLRPKRRIIASSFTGASAHRLTDCRLTSSRRATSACVTPSSRSFLAASRRSCSASVSIFCPIGIPMPDTMHEECQMSLL